MTSELTLDDDSKFDSSSSSSASSPYGSTLSSPSSAADVPDYALTYRPGYKNKWDYALKLPSFDKDQPSKALDTFKLIFAHLVDVLGADHVWGQSSGLLEIEHSFIMVTAPLHLLEHQARSIHLNMPVNTEDADFKFSDPFMPFDRKMKEGRLFKHPQNMPCQTPSSLPCGCNIFTPYQQQELVRSLVCDALDAAYSEMQSALHVNKGLRELTKLGAIVDIFPLHKNGNPIFYLNADDWTREHATYRHALFASNSMSSSSEPNISYIRDYFGEKIGLYFAFMHHYNKFLLILFMLGVVLMIVQYFYTYDNPLVPVYAILILIWSVLLLKFWVRRNNDLTMRWGMEDYESQERELEDFVADIEANGHIKDRRHGFYESGGRWVDMSEYIDIAKARHGHHIQQFVPTAYRDTGGSCPKSCFFFYGGNDPNGEAARAELASLAWRYFKESTSISGLFAMVGVTVVATVSLLIARYVLTNIADTAGSIAAGAANAVSINILAYIYQVFAIKLTEWENHRTHSIFEDKLATKLFLFNFVNSYFSLFYIAFYKSQNGSMFVINNEKCQFQNYEGFSYCIPSLALQLLSLLLARPVINLLVGVVFPAAMDRLEKWSGGRNVRKQMKASNPMLTDKELDQAIANLTLHRDEMCLAEKQGDRIKYEVHPAVNGVFDDWNDTVLGFGYVVLFGAAFPLAPLIMFLSNVIEISADAWKIFHDYQRPRYLGATDIGRWEAILKFIIFASIISNSGFMLFTSSQIQSMFGYPALYVSVFICFTLEHILLAILLLIWFSFNDRRPGLREDIALAEAIKRAEYELDEWHRARDAVGYYGKPGEGVPAGNEDGKEEDDADDADADADADERTSADSSSVTVDIINPIASLVNKGGRRSTRRNLKDQDDNYRSRSRLHKDQQLQVKMLAANFVLRLSDPDASTQK